MTNLLKITCAGLLTGISYVLGGWDTALETLFVATFVDVFSGIIKAIYKRELSSKIGRKGLMQKLGNFAMVAVGAIIDRSFFNSGIETAYGSGFVRTFVIYYLVANEGVSILENLAQMNLPVPKFLLNSLEKLKKEEEVNWESVKLEETNE